MSDKWRALWNRILSTQTARFVLALLALGFAAFGGYKLLPSDNPNEVSEPGEAAIFAVGQLFALAAMAFGYYFGSTARGDEKRPAPELEDTP